MKAHVLLVVEDDADIRSLVRLTFAADPAFELDGQASAVEDALIAARQHRPDLIVLDHRLEGDATGLDAAPDLKAEVPDCTIILFSASEELRTPALDSPWIDAFLLKTEMHKLVPLAKRLLQI